ncbi:Ribosomal-protein-alanine N-acetyltransferase [Corynebacterium kutscheri]|uniref:Acetyltransferase n=1 Tax=Corynebacterium kutscheri TaxID=35755 RepID=A0A0F6TCW8_9CORY|nr:N-acetyltransferase [Corynebacterium kutscheri]AKE40626.1 acetyltransferase [Corynebacterium kutscheri]VEH04825.1 Ribosomal-protein-alanine N-acetyltransferase [Corynebacterium kutscheri]VEH11023.1 Ribosomal-protein-alanine N-acetyltransferase [Corynebacterium kutscheri]VEH80498.1 Ribosomal-protein-alanine N-acetyltransferase [Corynebacterium kutscheri]
MQIRQAITADAWRLAELEAVLFPGDNPWTAQDFLAEFAQAHTFYLIASLGQKADSDTAEFAKHTGEKTGEEIKNREEIPAENAEIALGYAGLAMLGPADDPEFEIHTIGVDPRAQRSGIATALMDNLMFIVDKYGGPVFLEVRTDNEPAIALYRKYGFEVTGVRKNYYQPSGADAFIMVRSDHGVKQAKGEES